MGHGKTLIAITGGYDNKKLYQEAFLNPYPAVIQSNEGLARKFLVGISVERIEEASMGPGKEYLERPIKIREGYFLDLFKGYMRDIFQRSNERRMINKRPPASYERFIPQSLVPGAVGSFYRGPGAGKIRFGHKISFPPKPTSAPSDFLKRANALDRRKHTDAALDIIYDNIDIMLRDRKYETVDFILKSVNPSEFSVDVLLGLLTATLPARTKLPSRSEFFGKVEGEIRNRKEWEEGLLTGLES
jgi:hypothetical protein